MLTSIIKRRIRRSYPPVASDGNVYLPANSAQWQERGIAIPNSWWLMQATSGNIPDVAGVNDLTAVGTLDYSQTVTGWNGSWIGVTETAGERLTLNSANYSPAANSVAGYGIYSFAAVGASLRNFLSLGSVTNPNQLVVGLRTNSGLQLACAGTTTNSVSTAYTGANTVHPILLVYNRTAGTVVLYTDLEQLSGTYGATVNDVTAKGPASPGAGAAIPAPLKIRFSAWWSGANAETIGKDTLLRLGWPLVY